MSWLGSLFGAKDLQTQANADNAAQQQALQDYAPGGRVYESILNSQGQAAADAAWNTATGHVQAEVGDSQNIDTQLTDAFQQGAQEGAQNMAQTAGQLFSAFIAKPSTVALQALLKAIPWWWWLVGLGFLFFYFGGAARVKRLAKG
jgi:hypothetical protein